MNKMEWNMNSKDSKPNTNLIYTSNSFMENYIPFQVFSIMQPLNCTTESILSQYILRCLKYRFEIFHFKFKHQFEIKKFFFF